MSSALLIFDGECGFCARSVQIVLRHDRQGTLRFAARQGLTAAAVLARRPEMAGVSSLLWIEDAESAQPQVLVRSDALLAIARYLGGMFRLALVASLLPRVLRDPPYALIARVRHRLAPSGVCFVPSHADRERFLP